MIHNLVLTPLSYKKGSKEHQYFLGDWCNIENEIPQEELKKISTQKYHWVDRNKLLNDSQVLQIIYEDILVILSKKLNKYHKTNEDTNYWRIIIGPWLYFYIISMFDRWESIRIFFSKFSYAKVEAPKGDEKIFKNIGAEDYRSKACYSDQWNNLNFLRIINFKYKDQINLNLVKEKAIKYDPEKLKPSKFNFKNFCLLIVNFIDEIFSSYGIKKNKVIIESLYFSKINLLKLIFKLRIFPCFYVNTFKDKKIDKNIVIDKKIRSELFTEKDLNSDFKKYLFFCLKDDFPISYLEKFKALDNLNKKINTLNNKVIFSGVSHIFNERYKIWLARMLNQGGKFFVVSHGGCIPFDIHQHLFSHEVKISNKIIMSHKPIGPKEIQLSPVHLLKTKKNKKINAKKCLVLSCETLRYPVKIQSWPYVEEYKLWLGDIYNFISNLNENIQKKIVYRCGSPNDGFKTSKQLKNKFPNSEISSIFKSSLNEEFKKTRLIISTYPDTATAEAIMSNIPVVITFSDNIYKLSKDFNLVLQDLIKNKIFFSDPVKASNHVNEIWKDPYEWWHNKKTKEAVDKFKNYAFDIKKNWDEDWSKFIKKQIH